MKSLIAALAIIWLGFAAPASAFSLEELENGASAWCLPEETKWSDKQAMDATRFRDYLSGFLQGVNVSPLLILEEEPSPLFYPDDWMYDMDKAAPSFLAFVKLHRPKGFVKGKEGIPSTLLMAWYLSSHSKAGVHAKSMKEILLKEYFSPSQLNKDGTVRKQTEEGKTSPAAGKQAGSPSALPDPERINKEVADVMAGEHGKLPAAVRSTNKSSKTTQIEAKNSTEYTMTVQMSGPTPKEMVIPPGETKSISVTSGAYKVAARVDAIGVIPFAGSESFLGGGYDYTFYIKTTIR